MEPMIENIFYHESGYMSSSILFLSRDLPWVKVRKIRVNSVLDYGNGSFRPRVVSALSRFGPGSFRPGSFRPGSIRPWVVSAQFGGSFRPIFSQLSGLLPKVN